MRLAEVADLVGGRLHNGDPEAEIRGVQTLRAATEDEAAFLANRRYKADFMRSRAGVVLVGEDVFPDCQRPIIRTRDPYLAFAKLQRHFYPEPKAQGRRHPKAVIAPTAELAEDVDVAAGVVIGENVRIGAGCRIGEGCIIAPEVSIGRGCLLHPRVVIAAGCVLGERVIIQAGAVIGSDGFGYAWDGEKHVKIPQTGRVILEDDVEIGANSCIDRGTIGDTVIGRGSKLDNLIQIGHNVEVGAHSIMASQVGISGSTQIGRGCQFGGQAGLAGHLQIGDGCRLAAQSGVMSDLPAGGTYAGSPAMPHRLWLKVSALLLRLPQIWQDLGKLKAKAGGGKDGDARH